MRNSTARQNWSWQCRQQSDSGVWVTPATSRDHPRSAPATIKGLRSPCTSRPWSAQLAQQLQHLREKASTSGCWRDTWLEPRLVLCMDRWQTLVRNKPVHLGTEPNSSTVLIVTLLSLVQEFSWGIISLNTPESYRGRKTLLISTFGIDN